MRPDRIRRRFGAAAVVALAAAAATVMAVAAFAAVLSDPPAAPGQSRVPPAPGRWATDEAGFLERRTVESLDARLEAYERQTGHQLLVWIGRSLGPNEALEDWAVRTFAAWKVGRKGLDDGLVRFIFAEDRKIRLEVGYGLEDKVPDAYAYRVINNVLVPGFRAGRPDQAVEAAVTALIGYISGDENAAGGQPAGAPGLRGRSAVKSIFTGIVVLIVIIIFITNPSLALWLLINILSGGGRGGRGGGGWGGGGWGGGGGFSGGGGRSGGGGASGGW